MGDVRAAAVWLKSERERLGWSTSEVARRAREIAERRGDPLKLTQQSISHFENDHAKSVPRWLRYVRQAIEQDGGLPETEASAGTSDDRMVMRLGLTMIPEVDIAYSMGGGSIIEEAPPTTMVPFRRDWLSRLTRGGPADVFLTRGEGDSMMPTILDGDDVLVNRADRSIRHQDKIWALGYGELAQIKRVRRLASGMFQLNSDNPTVTPIKATEDELFIVGRVIWVGRRM
jgi:phage repressor protein C with HTH and peptisase S24 domain